MEAQLKGINVKFEVTYTSNLYDLLKTYSSILLNNEKMNHLTIAFSELHSVDSAIQRLKNIFGTIF